MRNSDEMLAGPDVPAIGAIAPGKKDKTPPPIELPPFMVALGSLPPLTEEVTVAAMTQLRTHLATCSSPDDTAALQKSLTALKILLGYHGRLLGVLHSLFKQLVYQRDEPTEFRMPSDPFRFPFTVQPIADAIPALSALSALPPLSSLSPEITQYLATIEDKFYRREFHERLFYDLKRIKSILTPYFNLVAALSKQQPATRRQAAAPQAPHVVPESRTPLQVLGKRYRLTLEEQMFYQALAKAGEAGIYIGPTVELGFLLLSQNLMRKLPRSYFDFRKPQHCRLSAIGLEQLKLPQSTSTLS